MPLLRADGRRVDQLRPVLFEAGPAPYAAGSVLVRFGSTQVICAATIEPKVPTWMKQQGVTGGWLTAEYSMLPYSTLERKPRDITRGKLDGRTIEIQRLIGRSLRAALDMGLLGERTLVVDCDVLQADGGTRTTAITGAFVAVVLALLKLKEQRGLSVWPVRDQVAAVSVGILGGRALLDLDYEEDSRAATDLNLVGTARRGIVEVQGTAEREPFSRAELNHLLDVAESGLDAAFATQRGALEERLARIGVKSLVAGGH